MKPPHFFSNVPWTFIGMFITTQKPPLKPRFQQLAVVLRRPSTTLYPENANYLQNDPSLTSRLKYQTYFTKIDAAMPRSRKLNAAYKLRKSLFHCDLTSVLRIYYPTEPRLTPNQNMNQKKTPRKQRNQAKPKASPFFETCLFLFFFCLWLLFFINPNPFLEFLRGF